MSIEQTLDGHLKDAMRAQDKPRVQCVRQIRSKLQEATNAPNFKGPVDDALLVQVISSYVKQLEKSCQELGAGGSRGEALVAQYQAEVSYLSQFLPKQLTDDEVRGLIAAHLQAAGNTDVTQAGKVLGALMKDHRGRLNVPRTKVLIDEALQPAAQAAP